MQKKTGIATTVFLCDEFDNNRMYFQKAKKSNLENEIFVFFDIQPVLKPIEYAFQKANLKKKTLE